MKYLLLLILILIVFAAVCAKTSRTVNDKGPLNPVKVTYAFDEFAIHVVFENEETYDIVKQGLYWHSTLVGKVITIKDREFLDTVLPVLDYDVSSVGPLFVSQKEAVTFYKNSFRSIGETLDNGESKVRFHVDVEGAE